MNQAKNGAAEGFVAYADFQTAGRGRLDRQWEAPAGTSLLCSILLRAPVEPEELQLVVATVALAARAALVRLSGVRPDLKWPNDLIVADKKLAGLLAEVVTTDEGLATVVGIGINLTHAGPDAVRATSILEESGLTITSRALLDILLFELEWRRALLDTREGRAQIREEYEGALRTIGQRVRVELVGETVVGDAVGVDESGQLVVLVEDLRLTFSVGDVVHLRAHVRGSHE